MSVKRPKAEVARRWWLFRFVPKGDIGGSPNRTAIWHIKMPVEEPSTASQANIHCGDLQDNCALGNLSGFMGTWDVVGDEGVGFVREAGHNGCSTT